MENSNKLKLALAGALAAHAAVFPQQAKANPTCTYVGTRCDYNFPCSPQSYAAFMMWNCSSGGLVWGETDGLGCGCFT